MIKPNIIVYTDGSSRGNPGPGGYGIVMQKFGSNYIKEFSEGYRRTCLLYTSPSPRDS